MSSPIAKHYRQVSSIDRKHMGREGTVGGPCHAVTAAGHFCQQRAVVVANDGWGYCKRHAPKR